MLDDVIIRLRQQVPFLQGRVEGAANLLNLTETRTLAPYGTAAHVFPAALRGGSADAGTGIFRQMFDEAVSIVIAIRSNDRNGDAALENLRPNLMSIVGAIAGWAPNDEVGVFRLVAGRVLSMTGGLFLYQIDFSIQDQLRIQT